MSNEKNRDVQDLIAEFVSSKDQLLHEEIISSIKRESFGIKDDNIAIEVKNTPSQVNNEQKIIVEEIAEISNNHFEQKHTRELEEKIAELHEKNLKLQEELIVLQMKESQENASGKSINTDDLRMEFLNFTSAHIQQFNTRIKRTEEMIESHISKTQNIPEKKSSGKTYPVWLFWANLVALGVVASYFLYKMLSGSTDNPQNFTPPAITKKIESSKKQTDIQKVPFSKQNTGKQLSEKTAAVPENTVTNKENIVRSNSPSPFHPTNATTVAKTNLPSQQPERSSSVPLQVIKKTTPTINSNVNLINSKPIVTNSAARKPVSNNLPKPVATTQKPITTSIAKPVVQNAPKQIQNKITNTKNRPVKEVYKASVPKESAQATPKTQTDKKQTQKEKVYFGED